MNCVVKLVLAAALAAISAPVVARDEPATPGECLEAPYTAARSAAQTRLATLVRRARITLETFPSLLAILDDAGPELCLDGLPVTEKAFFDPALNRIHLSGHTPPSLMLLLLVHELRHAEQFGRGICPSDTLAMRSYARAVLALEADANVVMLLVAWHRREAGDIRLWAALETWPMTADIASRFLDDMTRDGDVSAAASAAFDQWYASDERRRLYYVATCSDYLDRQDAAHDLPGTAALSPDYLSRLCILPGGDAYDCDDVIGPRD